VLEGVVSEQRVGRKSWGLLSLELWQRAFHDRAREFRSRLSGRGGDKGRMLRPAEHRRASAR
jgi:hypothetical protein